MARADPDRRRFLKSTAALAALTALRPRLSLAAGGAKTAISISALPPAATFLERFKLAVEAGFFAVEISTVDDSHVAEQIRRAANRAGIRIHSVLNVASRQFPLSSADAEVVRHGVNAVRTSLGNARSWGADFVVIAPAAAAAGASYRDAWRRSQAVIGEHVLPLARALDVVLAVEEVWDGFILSPQEVARYVDAFASPWVKASYDMSHAVFYASPCEWIRALGSRLVNVRASRADAGARAALEQIAYDGWLTAASLGTSPTRG